MKKISLLLLLLLSSCALLGPDYQRSEKDLPANYSERDSGTDASRALTKEWWKHYQDEKLNELVALSLKNNTDIQLAVARIEEADAAMREVGASLFPEIIASGRATRSKVTELGAFPVFVSPIRNNYTIGVSTNYEIDFWGKVRRAKEAATASALASRFSKETVELSLIGLVSSNYLQLRGIEAQIAVTKNSLKSSGESLSLTKRRLEGGIASSLEVSQAEVVVSNLDAQLIELYRLRALSLHQLAVLTGELDLKLDFSNNLTSVDERTSNLKATNLSTVNNNTTYTNASNQNPAKQNAANLNPASHASFTPVDISALPVPPVPPAGLPSALLENRPDIRQAEQALIAQNAQIGVAKAALYPSISLTGSYGGESLELGDILKSGARVWTLGLGLDLPIFDAGRRKARVDQASARQKQALAQYQEAIRNAFKEVNDALITRRLNVEREQSLAASEASAKKALAVAENRYKAGYSAYLEVLDAQRVYNSAALANVQARQASTLATVDLFKALGGDWRAETKSDASNDYVVPNADSTMPASNR